MPGEERPFPASSFPGVSAVPFTPGFRFSTRLLVVVLAAFLGKTPREDPFPPSRVEIEGLFLASDFLAGELLYR